MAPETIKVDIFERRVRCEDSDRGFLQLGISFSPWTILEGDEVITAYIVGTIIFLNVRTCSF